DAVSPRVERSWWIGSLRWKESGVASGWDHPHAVQVVARGPGLVPGTERGAFGALGEPAGRTRPRLAAAATGPPVSGDVMVEQVLRVPPEEPVDNLAGYDIVDHDLLPQSGGVLTPASTSGPKGRQ